MSRYFQGLRRNRTYERKFDHEECRRRLAAGESKKSLAEEYGINPAAIYYMLKRATEAMPAVAEPMPIRDWRFKKCPTCQGRMARGSRQCHECFQDARLQPTRIKRTPGQRGLPLGHVLSGSVVEIGDRFGVVGAFDIDNQRRTRHVDFWDGPPEWVLCSTRVNVEPSFVVVEA